MSVISKITFDSYEIKPYKHYGSADFPQYYGGCSGINQSINLSPGAIALVRFRFKITYEGNGPGQDSTAGAFFDHLNDGSPLKLYFKNSIYVVDGASDATNPNDAADVYLYLNCTSSNLPNINIQNADNFNNLLRNPPQASLASFNLGGWNVNIIRTTVPGFNYTFDISGYVCMTEDLEGFATTSNNVPNRNFLYNHINSTNLLANDISSVYNIQKKMRMNFWIRDKNNKFTYAKGEIPINNRWYNTELNGVPNVTITNPLFTYFRPTESGQVVSDLSPTENTRVQFTFTCTDYNEIVADAILIQVGGVDSNNNILRAVNHTIREINNNDFDNDVNNPLPYIEGGFTDSTNDSFLLPSLKSKNGQGNRLMGKSQRATANFNGNISDWNLYFNIPGDQLSGSVIYRIIIVLYCRQGGSLSCFTSYSFISDPIMATGLPTLCPPECGGFFSDYLDTFGQRLIVSPQERIKATCFWRAARFELCRQQYNHQMIASAKQVKVTILEEVDGFRHIFDEIIATKPDGAGAFLTQNDDLKVYILPDPYLREIRVAYTYRIRYEADILNLRSESLATGATVFPPAANQDWTNRNLIIEFQLILEHKTPVLFKDILVKRMFFYVHPYDDYCLDIKFVNSAGFEMSNFCSFEEFLNVIVTQCPDDDINMPQDDEGGTKDTGPGYDYFIGAVDKQSYSINQIKEHESITEGTISQLTNAPIISIDDQFEHDYDSGFDNQAMAVCDANGFESGQQYRFVAIKKKTPPAKIHCNDPNIRSGGTTNFINYDIELGNPGIVVLWFDMFGIPDAARLMWGGLCLFRTYQPRYYKEYYDKYAAPPLLQEFGPLTTVEYPATNALPLGGDGTGVPLGDPATYDVTYLPDAVPRIGAFTFDYQPQNYPGYPTSIQLLMSGIRGGTGWNGGLLCGMQVVPFNKWANDKDFRFTPDLLAPNGEPYARRVISNAVGQRGTQGTDSTKANYMYQKDGNLNPIPNPDPNSGEPFLYRVDLGFDPRMHYYVLCVELGSKEQLQQVFNANNGVWMTPCFNDVNGPFNNPSYGLTTNRVQTVVDGAVTSIGVRCKSPFSENSPFYTNNRIHTVAGVADILRIGNLTFTDALGLINSRSEMHIFQQSENINYDNVNFNPNDWDNGRVNGIVNYRCDNTTGSVPGPPPADFLRGNSRPLKQYVMLSNGFNTANAGDSQFGYGYQTCYANNPIVDLGYPATLIPKAHCNPVSFGDNNIYKDYFFWDGIYSATNPVHYAVIVIKNIEDFMFNFEVYPNV